MMILSLRVHTLPAASVARKISTEDQLRGKTAARRIIRQICNDVVSVSRRTNISSRSRLFTSRAQDVIFDQIMQTTLIKWAKSVAAVYGSVNRNRLMHYLLTLCIIIIIIIEKERYYY